MSAASLAGVAGCLGLFGDDDGDTDESTSKPTVPTPTPTPASTSTPTPNGSDPGTPGSTDVPNGTTTEDVSFGVDLRTTDESPFTPIRGDRPKPSRGVVAPGRDPPTVRVTSEFENASETERTPGAIRAQVRSGNRGLERVGGALDIGSVSPGGSFGVDRAYPFGITRDRAESIDAVELSFVAPPTTAVVEPDDERAGLVANFAPGVAVRAVTSATEDGRLVVALTMENTGDEAVSFLRLFFVGAVYNRDSHRLAFPGSSPAGRIPSRVEPGERVPVRIAPGDPIDEYDPDVVGTYYLLIRPSDDF
ncbi:hypothetical protein BRD17_01800 [Halobacteriales archaeon SW_7_68_16]|nr:MAG: hypothetical protein BRD17_01800 [Halobacteriales archaeon SW_7_68_16]